MAHPLDGARAKLTRAEGLINELELAHNEFMARRPYALDEALDPETSEWVVRLRVREEPPLQWSVVIGDAIHNLRSALDHLAWQLVLLNGAEPSVRTQFPIYDDEAAFGTDHARRLYEGMSEADIETIRSVQPFRQPAGEELHFLKVLQELSNIDKHRVVHTTLVERQQVQFRIEGGAGFLGMGEMRISGGPMEDGSELVTIAVVVDRPDPDIRVEAELALGVAFADEELSVYAEHVLGVLIEVHEFVTGVFDAFEPRFA
jgi:hypothetical protein